MKLSYLKDAKDSTKDAKYLKMLQYSTSNFHRLWSRGEQKKQNSYITYSGNGAI